MQFSRKFKKSSFFLIFICIVGFYILLTNFAHLLWMKQESSIENQQHVIHSNSSNIRVANKPTDRDAHRSPSVIERDRKQQPAFTSNQPNVITSKRPTKISLADEYCNFPETIKNHHDEGKVKNETSGGWKLMQAHIVLRHGDRSPLNQIFYEANNIKANYCRLNEDAKPNHELLHEFIEDIKRDYAGKNHLSRGHKIAIPFPNSKICSNGYLSQQGVVQELENGVVLKKQYSNHFDVISNPSVRLKKVYVETTATARTYQSAIAFLYGFLPKFELQQVDMQLSTSGVFSTVYKTCKKLTTLDQELLSVKYAYFMSDQKKNETNKKLAKMLSMTEHSGPFIDRILNGFLCKGYELPCTDEGCVSKKELEIFLEQETNLRKSVEHGVYKDISLLSMQPFLKKISESMKAIIKEPSSQPETFVYSGHDITLKPLLCALSLDEFKWPKMASRLVLELWKNSSKNKYYIRVIYNGKDYTNRLKFCTSKELCSYSEFADFVNVKMFKHFNASSLIAACSM